MIEFSKCGPIKAQWLLFLSGPTNYSYTNAGQDDSRSKYHFVYRCRRSAEWNLYFIKMDDIRPISTKQITFQYVSIVYVRIVITINIIER